MLPSDDDREGLPFEFRGKPLRVPEGVRIFMICGTPVVIPGPDESTQIFVHRDDFQRVMNANPDQPQQSREVIS